MVPPVIVAADWKDRDFLPLEIVAVSRFHIGQALPESQDVRLEADTLPQDPDHSLRIVHIVIPLIFKADDGDWAPIDGECLAIDLDTLDLGRLALDQCVLGEDV